MIKFIKLKEEHLEQVLNWRTKEDVTRYMITDIEKDMQKQREWYVKISKSTRDKYWVISINNTYVGLIYLNNIDFVHKRCSWGYYIGEEAFRMYGAIIPFYLYHYVFTKLNLHKLTAEIIADNENVIKLNKLHGFREVGIYREHVYKNGKFHDLVLMELLKKDWENNKRVKKYEGYFEE